MANPTQLKILKKGVKAWNEWRKAHMSKAEHIDLSHEDFHGADLRGANLSQGHPFGANIYWSDFVDADLSDARLNGANLSVANLNGAKLLRADLNGVNLNFATLKRSNLSCARIGWTSFGYVDFREVTGLDTVIHDAPSSIGIETLYMSQGEIPDKFLRDAGVREEIIDIARSIRNGPPIQWHSCFISYSTKDEEFVLRLHSRMREANMRVWFAREDLKGGKKLHEQLFEAIQMNDRLLIVLSEHSIQSDWVKNEVGVKHLKWREGNAVASCFPSGSAILKPCVTGLVLMPTLLRIWRRKCASISSPTSPTGKTTTPLNPPSPG